MIDIKEVQKKVKVGDKCTVIYYTDREPGTITAISASGKTIRVKENKCISTSQVYGDNEWEITDELYPEEMTFRYHPSDGNYYTVGKGRTLGIGYWHKYYDYSF